ncbi:hypothetical protein E1B28_006511 [Marasmius oreades]|uniref:NEDD8-activating enzyme E1 regulatory subunit n=1 Tax=Marasmius oreades TaxID=181124 RepID=A0A9P7S7P6_9AGAR|nr:uncharacterized protein E1B28_006511 [Marasmius oreades]KAG7095811.1 hypothetical protein E1B28_006511 [Marasmius oreades]
MKEDSQTLDSATTAVTVEGQPDHKTRRYDRQLRLWAASGQSALESSRILVIPGSATSTSILKNLVLPGIGHFTIVDHTKVTPQDAGNNFFLEGPSSIGRSRAEETVRLLLELNESVEGKADQRDIAEILENDPSFITSFTLVIAHNLHPTLLDRLSTLLWSDPLNPPLIVVNSAGFLAEFSIQFHQHPIIESHTETAPSLRIDKAFPALYDYATGLDFSQLDSTDHGHVPYVIILVQLLDKWRREHDGKAPKTSEEKKAFKATILAMKKKIDEENFDEAEALAYRCWTETTVPHEIAALFNEPALESLTSDSPHFFHLLYALKRFAAQSPYVLPLTSSLPDMKASTESYIHLQKLYKARSTEEKESFKSFLQVPVPNDLVDTFVKNAHGLRLLKGKKWSDLDSNPSALADKLPIYPKEISTHLALSALRSVTMKHQGKPPTAETLTEEALALLPPGTELPDVFSNAIGELVRAPTADLPNSAAFLGGLVAQEAIKMITKQYEPINGYCIIDLIDSWTGTM